MKFLRTWVNLDRVHQASTVLDVACASIEQLCLGFTFIFTGPQPSRSTHNSYTCLLPFNPATPPTFLTWPRRGFTAVIVRNSMGRLWLLYIPKTNFFCYFFSETIILGILWVRTKKSELQTRENNASNIIIHW
jgi:hypothetical protein